MKIETKVVPVVQTKVLDESKGIIGVFVSVTGVVDSVKDRILPGAYQKTLVSRTPKGAWCHSWTEPVSKTLEAEELLPGDDRLPTETRKGEPWPTAAGALYVETQFNLGTQRGREAFSDVMFYGKDSEFSIGYSVPPGGSKVDKKTGVREITYIDLYEYSWVLFGAMDLTQTAGVKDAQEAWKLKAEAGEVKEGQVFESDRDPEETTPDQPVSDPVLTPDKPTTLNLTGGNTVTYAGGTIVPQVATTSASGTVTFVPDAPQEPKQAEFVVSWTEAGQAAVDAVSAWAVEESTREGADLASILTEAGKRTDALLGDKANVSITSLESKASVTLSGSYEERQTALRDALPEFLDDNFEDVDVNARDEWGYQATWVTIEATFNARVVAVVYDFSEDGGEPRYFDCTYAWDQATSEATVRAGREVVIQGVVVPKSAAVAAQVKAALSLARDASAGVPAVEQVEPDTKPEAKSAEPMLSEADLLMLERYKLDA